MQTGENLIVYYHQRMKIIQKALNLRFGFGLKTLASILEAFSWKYGSQFFFYFSLINPTMYWIMQSYKNLLYYSERMQIIRSNY